MAYSIIFFFNDTATTEIYTLSLHDALPILAGRAYPARSRGDHLQARHGRHASERRAGGRATARRGRGDRHTLREAGAPRSEEHTSELQSRQYLVCRLLLEKKI